MWRVSASFIWTAKLYAAGSRDSNFRTFYFEPKKATSKVLDDAVHFIVGFEHEPREDISANTMWKFTRWDLVDLSKFKVKLKSEFQASNRDTIEICTDGGHCRHREGD
jgi:hypothetical protein